MNTGLGILIGLAIGLGSIGAFVVGWTITGLFIRIYKAIKRRSEERKAQNELVEWYKAYDRFMCQGRKNLYK